MSVRKIVLASLASPALVAALIAVVGQSTPSLFVTNAGFASNAGTSPVGTPMAIARRTGSTTEPEAVVSSAR